MTKKGPKISCEAFKRGQCFFCVQPELCISVPTAHHEYEIQDRGIMWGRKKAVKHWEDTLDDVELLAPRPTKQYGI